MIYLFINLLTIFKALLLSLYLVHRKLKKRNYSCKKKKWANTYGIKMTVEEVLKWEEDNKLQKLKEKEKIEAKIN